MMAFGLMKLGLKSMIYHTPGDDANHYTTEALNYLSVNRTQNTAVV
jgi:hypothetical protein